MHPNCGGKKVKKKFGPSSGIERSIKNRQFYPVLEGEFAGKCCILFSCFQQHNKMILDRTHAVGKLLHFVSNMIIYLSIICIV
jgi:hypothetical protein